MEEKYNKVAGNRDAVHLTPWITRADVVTCMWGMRFPVERVLA